MTKRNNKNEKKRKKKGFPYKSGRPITCTESYYTENKGVNEEKCHTEQ